MRQPVAITTPINNRRRAIGSMERFRYLFPSREEGHVRQTRVHARRRVWAVLRDIEAPLDATTRVRVFTNCHQLSPRTPLHDPSYTTSLSFFGGEHAHHDGGAARGGGGFSACVDLTPELSRLDHPRSLRADRLTVQLLPHCSNGEANVSNIRPRRVEVVIL